MGTLRFSLFARDFFASSLPFFHFGEEKIEKEWEKRKRKGRKGTNQFSIIYNSTGDLSQIHLLDSQRVFLHIKDFLLLL